MHCLAYLTRRKVAFRTIGVATRAAVELVDCFLLRLFLFNEFNVVGVLTSLNCSQIVAGN